MSNTPLLDRAFRTSLPFRKLPTLQDYLYPNRKRVKHPIAPYSLNSIQSVRSAMITAMLSKHRGEKGLHDLFPEAGQVDEFTNRPFTKDELRRYYMSKGRYSGNNKNFIP